MEYQALIVGERVCAPSADGTLFDLTDSGALLVLKYNRPTSREKGNVKSGVAQFRLAVTDGIAFFLCRFGAGPWMDAPYHPDFSDYTIFRPAEGMGLLLHILLVDASTGVLVAQRVIGLTTAFTSAILDTVVQLPPSGADYHQRLAAIYSRYTTIDLCAIAHAEN